MGSIIYTLVGYPPHELLHMVAQLLGFKCLVFILFYGFLLLNFQILMFTLMETPTMCVHETMYNIRC
jgi:hypothetical protein